MTIWCRCGHSESMHYRERTPPAQLWHHKCVGRNKKREEEFLKAWEEYSKATPEQKKNWTPCDDFVPEYCNCNEFWPLSG